jgi:hypothetical protein
MAADVMCELLLWCNAKGPQLCSEACHSSKEKLALTVRTRLFQAWGGGVGCKVSGLLEIGFDGQERGASKGHPAAQSRRWWS